MNKAQEFYSKITEVLGRINDTQSESIRKAAEMVADSIADEKILYLLGGGHSLMIAAEAYHRAGGLAPVDVIHDKSFGRAERCEGYAKQLLDWYNPPPGSVVVIISNSGRNALGIETALECRQRGVKTIAVTSLAHSRSVSARHPSGKRLFEAADLVIDNCGVPGDAILEVEGVPGRICATSTIAGAMIVDMIIAQTVQNLVDRGIEPPVFISANVEGGDEHNKKVFAKYQHLIKGL
ncbi:MAG: SIS domain-containing protein [Armatimonadetes bacterium]|nr:SIS domain-containing protein [Armatimonadota bacterium]